MATRIKSAFRFYLYSAVIGLSAFVLALIGGRKAEDNRNFLSSIPSASADIPAGTCQWHDYGGEGLAWMRFDNGEGRWVNCPGGGSGDGDCDGGGDCGD